MTLIKGLPVIIFSSTLLAHSALALQFTYNSDELNFLQGYLGGEPSDLVGSHEPPFPSFSASFVGTTENLTSTFLSGDLTVGFPGNQQLLQNLPTPLSSITLNPDGSIAAWHFLLALTQTLPQTQDSPGGTNSWLVESSYGANSCNCDSYTFFRDIFTPRPYYSWEYVNTVGALFAGDNAPDNWSIDNTDVPEPLSYFLLFSGLAMIGIRRFRNAPL